jgi:hypothetical protein
MTKQATGEAYLETVLAPRLSVTSFWTALRRSLAKSRCRLIHRSISHPVHGTYRCWTCLHEFDTDF